MNVNNDDFASGDVWLIAEPGSHSNLEGANPVRTSWTSLHEFRQVCRSLDKFA